MVDGPDVSVALRGVQTPSQALGFVRWFADAWLGRPLQPADGCTEDELASVETDLGFRLPTALRQGYALFGRRDDLTRQQGPLIPPAGLCIDNALNGILVFRRENQDCAFWGIPVDEIERDDPPVLVESHRGWVPFLDRMSLAWVELVLSESLFEAGSRYDACELPQALLPGLRTHYTRVDLPDHPMWVGDDDSPALVRGTRSPGAPGRHSGPVLDPRARTNCCRS
ncbi:hypothetical protein GCM10025734_80420 [Kitasatospora paranensis]|uniref:SMI1/KNR4 family protein n=1 Tax=Kitasatospora paranensis TaxID=258053 RepID=UPI0031E91E0C